VRASDVVFFVSGAAALVYQVAWARLLTRLTGSDASGVALVLCVFMAGMGLGAWLAPGLVRRARDPRRTYAALAFALAAWAAATPHALARLDPVAGLFLRSALACAVLLPPTLLMGASFPLMGRLVIATREQTGERTAGFYGANTLGAALGALLAPAALLPALGLTGALAAGAVLDVAAGALALRLPHPGPPLDAGAGAAVRSGLRLPERCGATAFALGATALALEVVLTRLLITVTGASVYAFAIVLAVFLAGIGLGGRQARTLLAAGRRRGTDPLALAGRCALALCIATFAGLLALRWQLGEGDLFAGLENRMPPETGALRLWSLHALLAGLALFFPALASGMALPAVVAAATERRPDRPREVVLGRVYALNTGGAALGSLAAAFVLLPVLGHRAALALALVPAWLVAALLAAPSRSGRRAWALGTAAAVVLGALALRPATDRSEGERLALFVGRDATVSVDETAEPGGARGAVRALRVNGKVVATTAPVDLRLQRLLACVPGLLHGEVERALVIGLGTGMTAGALLDLPSLASLDVFEISDAVVRAAPSFARWNGALLDDERVRVELADGRHALHFAGVYDLITADPIHPWTRGSSDLYALEHFETMAAHLAPDGIASQWLPLYQLSRADVLTVVATWCAAFPHTSAWLTAYDLVLVGGRAPLAGPAELAAGPWPPDVARSLAEAGVHSPVELAALCVADDRALRELARDARPMRSDRPVLEFRAPFSYLAGYSRDVLAWAARRSFVEELPAASRARALEVRAALERFLERLPGGRGEAARRYGRELLELGRAASTAGDAGAVDAGSGAARSPR